MWKEKATGAVDANAPTQTSETSAGSLSCEEDITPDDRDVKFQQRYDELLAVPLVPSTIRVPFDTLRSTIRVDRIISFALYFLNEPPPRFYKI